MPNIKQSWKTDKSVKINHNPNSLYIPDHSCRILIIGGSGSGKTNSSLKLININELLTQFICMTKIHLNQAINSLSMKEKKGN